MRFSAGHSDDTGQGALCCQFVESVHDGGQNSCFFSVKKSKQKMKSVYLC